MKVSTTDAARVIHEVERAAGKKVAAAAWEELSPEYRSARADEVQAYLQSGIAATVGDRKLFTAIVDALR